jgi:WD40 repeat protein
MLSSTICGQSKDSEIAFSKLTYICEWQIWDIGSGQCLQTLEGHSDVVMDLLCWEQFLLSCSLDGTIRVSP